MTDGVRTFIFPVRDLAGARALSTRLLGVEPHTDMPYYVGFNVNGQEIALDPNGHAKGMTGPVAYWHVDDVRASMSALLDAGAEAQQEVTDVGGGRLTAAVKDADGNVISLIQSQSA